MLWSALRLPVPDDKPSPNDADLRALAVWALQFTPRVAVLDESVVMEVEASLRLFKGWRALNERVRTEAAELGATNVAWARNSLAALACARAGIPHGLKRPLDALLDTLPMDTISAVRPHLPTLLRLGARTLGDVRKLPRGGISRRFDKQLLRALDQAYGLAPEVYAWVELPDTFDARLELPFRVEHAPEMLAGTRRLLLQLCGWLTARHSGTTAVTLRWWHDAMRPKTAGEGGELTIRTAEATRNIDHLQRLLSENLAKLALLAPVGDLQLLADEVHALQEVSASLLPDTVRERESVLQLEERMAARFGADRVRRPVIVSDNRPEHACRWVPCTEPLPKRRAKVNVLASPTYLLAEPLRLSTRDWRPSYQGALKLLEGPHSIEDGWWDRDETKRECKNVVRDYWLAWSEHAGTLWIYQTRDGGDGTEAGWWLHGVFA